MKIVIYALSILLALVAPLHASAEENALPSVEAKTEQIAEAPFGLKWGMTEADAKAMGVTLTKKNDKGEGNQFTATGLPRILSDSEIVFLYFGFNDKLWFVGAIGKSFDNDPYGTGIRSRYDELRELLEKKYGKGEISHIQDREIYKGADMFLAGIKNGRSIHTTVFKKLGVSVQLSIGAEQSDSGYYVLRYENMLLAKEYEKIKKQHEEDAL